ncbi:MAG TPA: hypothetical protein OIM45_04960 [Clostridiaceae bacterium]|nr:MAG TPA: hypothetical protein [Caudoviricetes sp.]HJJ05195.1 hypothetical protein [Clostridiaceae bacterium]
MIIVSQDKEKIVNFDNLTQVYITQDEEETAYFIRYETVDSLYDDLGKYETEERAKEVLQEIYKNYADFELIRCINGNFQQHLIVGNKNKYFDIYEMPED